MNHEEVLKEIHENIITVDVRLLLKMQDIVLFFFRSNYFMGHFSGYFEGAKTFVTPCPE
jgi:hypothetical protein